MTPPKRPAVLAPPTASASPAVEDRAAPAPSLAERYRAVRGLTERLAAPLSPEDCAIQSMPDASPTRWHLAHTTWFFETFVLAKAEPGRSPFHPDFAHLFNSYYHSIGAPFPRAKRGLLSKPDLAEVREYRAHVDRSMEALLARGGEAVRAVASAIVLGLNHEQQHQELLLTDILHVFAQNPLAPAYAPAPPAQSRGSGHAAPTEFPSGLRPGGPVAPLTWLAHEGGVREIGHAGAGFAYDNESPRHRVFVEPFALGSRASSRTGSSSHSSRTAATGVTITGSRWAGIA